MIVSPDSSRSLPRNRVAVSGNLVMGLRWERPAPAPGKPGRQADLDAFCVSFDDRAQPVEAVHPGAVRNRNGSLLHTGDSVTGAGEWDDERIFVFLDALPEEVAALAFVARSATGRVFRDIPGAWCHLSDATTETPYLGIDLAACGYGAARCVAVLRRQPGGWRIHDRTEAGPLAVAAESIALGIEVKVE